MKKTIVTWKAERNVPIACPDRKPDPYTGEYSPISCAVYHYETIVENRMAEFETEKEAIDFADKAPLSCDEFKLDGVELEDKRQKPTILRMNLDGNGTTTVDGTNIITR